MSERLDKLAQLIRAENNMTVQLAAELVVKADIKVEDLEPFADYNHPPEDGYGRKMAILDNRFEIMVMTWNPGDFSAIHDHGYTQWGAVQVFGNVMHHTFSDSGDEFRIIKKEILVDGAVIRVSHPLIHQMGNVTSRPYLTLHVYGCDDYEGTVTADAKIYELENSLIKHTNGGAFYNLPDNKVYDISAMKPIERHTFVYYATLLLQYYERFDDDLIVDKRRNLLARLEALQQFVG
jgi:predicted metal-dependent enzyme (double-stranded beta helix superfamily)